METREVVTGMQVNMKVFRRKDITSLISNGQIIFSSMPFLTRWGKTKSKTKIIITIVSLELFCPMPYTIKKGSHNNIIMW